MTVKILALAGSTRSGSLNKKLIRVAAEAARGASADVTLIDLHDYAMPLYDGDLEEASGLPAAALELKRLIVDRHALLISTPEYNGSIPGTFKNAIDWASRPAPGEKVAQSFRGKVAALLSASPSRIGGLRSLQHLRHVLDVLNVIVIPDHYTLAAAHDAFDANDQLTDPAAAKSVARVAQRLVEATAKLAA